MNNTIKQFIAAKAFIRFGKKILIIRESAAHVTNTQVGKFDVIGGRVEPGENVINGLRREVKEECGLEISIGQPFFVNESRNEWHGEHWQIIRIFFDCTTSSEQIILNEEHDQFKWIDPKNYMKENVIENLYPSFDAFLKIK